MGKYKSKVFDIIGIQGHNFIILHRHPINQTQFDLKRNEKTLLKEMARGNKDAFSNAYKLYFALLCHYAYRYFNDQDEAYEIVQHTFLKIWEQRNKLEQVSSLKSYLFRCVHNACLNRIDHLKVTDNYYTKEKLQLKEIELENFEDTMTNNETERLLVSAINELPEKNQKILKLRYYNNMRYKEIAVRLNISERTVEAHLRKSIQELRKKLKNLHNEEYGINELKLSYKK